ncbi:MAG: hypothetical protein CM1200mP41_02890 [Gammaproteobacteria bacterium]|nr:MAG: hypothetical protein CM1200mP41_02890 [Gammaproteobacteria bacterium]
MGHTYNLNALELVTPERRALGFPTEHMMCLDPQLAPIVGYARTATVRAVTAPTIDRELVKAQRAGYYELLPNHPDPPSA